MDDRTVEGLGYVANYSAVAFALLTKCLVRNGSLVAGQFEAELRATIEHPDAQRGRLDYQFLKTLLEVLEDRVPNTH
jgi:hypothetical protein